jgi:hypothetical protein
MRQLAWLFPLLVAGCASLASDRVVPTPDRKTAESALRYAFNCGLHPDDLEPCVILSIRKVELRHFECTAERAGHDGPFLAFATCTFTARVSSRRDEPGRRSKITTADFALDRNQIWSLSAYAE